MIGLSVADIQGNHSNVHTTLPRRRGAHQVVNQETVVTPLEERTVTLRYVTSQKRTTERKKWLQRQDPKNRSVHIYGRLFVNQARELYFANFDGRGGVSMICWLVDKHKQCLCIAEEAYREALRNPKLGEHQFYQRCDGAWRAEDLRLDTQSSGRRP